MIWVNIAPVRISDLAEFLGFIPTFLNEADPRTARDQIDDNYAHGGGWRPAPGFTLDFEDMLLCYPEDPPMKPLAATMMRDEMILVYPHAWVVIITGDEWEVSRLD